MNEAFQLKRVLSYLFIGGIAALFALQWGPGAKGCDQPLSPQSREVAATVNGQEIPLKEFQRTYRSRLASMGSQIPESLARQIGLPTQVLNSMVDSELLAQAAEKQGILASDKEVREMLQKAGRFQKDGHFDLETYHEFLRDYERVTDVEFEATLRRQLSGSKLISMVEGAAIVSDDEVKSRYFREGNKANVTYARFLPAMFVDKVVSPKPAELAAFEKDHAKEISEYYEANKFLYQQPEKVKARHILIKVPADAPPAKKTEAKAKIENLRKEAAGGKDFAALAKDFSEDEGSKDKGGDLGFNERSAWVPEFADAAFKLKPGELSGPVETQFGFHLIKVDEKKAPEKKELKDVEPEIAKQLLAKEKAKALAKTEAEKALATVKSGKKSLTDLFPSQKEEKTAAAMRFNAETKPEATVTGEFTSASDQLPQLGPVPELMKQIFALEGPKVLDAVQPVNDGYLVVSVTERKKPSEAELATKKEELRAQAIDAKRGELQSAFIKALRKDGKVVLNQEAIGGKGGPEES